MTDAAMPVTERAVEQFVEDYLVSLGAEIRKEGNRWRVSLPDNAETTLELDDAVLEVAPDPDEIERDAFAIAPESEFVERLIDEAAERTPVGSMMLTGDDLEVRLPPWITEGPAEVSEHAFTPYYDRQALCALVHVGIETVSEYQTEELLSAAVDLNSSDERPRLAETYLELSEAPLDRTFEEGRSLEEADLSESLEAAMSIAEREVSSTVREVRERATRAAEVELDEYRQFVRQRREELDDEIRRLTRRIDDANDTIDDATDQQERVDALRKRKELRAERDDLRSEQEKLAAEIRDGFPEERREIRDRHSLTVRFQPVAVTTVTYERGDLDVSLRVDDASASRSYPYAVGIGIMENPACEQCGRELSGENAATISGGSLVGTACCER